mgnify:CR=1 FL=1
MLEEGNNVPNSEKNKLDLVVFIRQFWEERRFMITITLIFTFIGIVVAVFTQKQYPE